MASREWLERHQGSDHFPDVRKMVGLDSGSRPEEVKKVECRLTADDKKALKKPDTMSSW